MLKQTLDNLADVAFVSMVKYEFVKVNEGFPLTGREPTDGSSWKKLTSEAGDAMFLRHENIVHATTQMNQARSSNGPKKYFLGGIKKDINNGVCMVKYNHCSRDHAILVRKTREVNVHLKVTPENDDNVKMEASMDGEVLWSEVKKSDRNIQLLAVASEIHATLTANNKATFQSKVLYYFEGQKISGQKYLVKRNKLIKKKVCVVMAMKSAERQSSTNVIS